VTAIHALKALNASALALCLSTAVSVGCSPPTTLKTTKATKPPTTTTTTTAPATPTTHRLRGEIFASEWSVIAIAETPQQQVAASMLEPVINATLAEVDRQVSSWRRDSELSRVSNTRTTKPLPVAPSTGEIVAACVDVGAKTGGAFDITMQPLLALWGFTATTKGRVTERPSAEDIASAKARLGSVRVAGGSIIKSNADVSVDVSAVADGAAARAVAAVLSERGFKNFLVDVAGEVVVSGHGEKGPWRLGINTPTSSASPTDTIAMASFPAEQTSAGLMALSTSGTSRDHWELDGQRYSHILDPRTGAPVTHTLVSCTITGPDIVVADALSTACIVMDEAGTRKSLKAFPGYEAYFVHSPAGAPAGAAEPALVSTQSDAFPLVP